MCSISADAQDISPILAAKPSLVEDENTAALAATIAADAITNVLAAAVAAEIMTSVLASAAEAEQQQQQQQQPAPGTTKWLPPALRAGAGAATIAGSLYAPPLVFKPKPAAVYAPASPKPAPSPASAPTPFIPPARRALAALAAGGADSYAIWPALPQLTAPVTCPALSAAAPSPTPAAPTANAATPSGGQCQQQEQSSALADPTAQAATAPATSRLTTNSCKAKRFTGCRRSTAAALIASRQRVQSQPKRCRHSQPDGAATKAAAARSTEAAARRQQQRRHLQQLRPRKLRC